MKRAVATTMLKRLKRFLGVPLPTAERERMQIDFEEALVMLQLSASKAHATIEQLQELEWKFRDREPGERARLIRGALGLSRTNYYRLRAVAVPKSGTGAVSNLFGEQECE